MEFKHKIKLFLNDPSFKRRKFYKYKEKTDALKP